MTDSKSNPDPTDQRLPSYWEYLHVEELLALQGGLEGDEDQLSNHEVLFIVVHQVYELWFKLVLRELTTARDLIHRDPVPDQELSRLVSSLNRVTTIFEQAVSHFRVMETLSTRDFLDFRDKLLPASGFQSAQMRELEVLLGLDDERRLSLGADGGYLKALESSDGSPSPARARVERRKRDLPCFRDAVEEWLERTPIRGSCPGNEGDAEVVRGFIDEYLTSHRSELGDLEELTARQAKSEAGRKALAVRYEESHRQARAFLLAEDVDEGPDRARRSRIRAALVFIESYRELPLLAWPRAVLDGLIALEQGVTIFRQRHARMVEREIGRRVGTGGSAGVDYLDQTAVAYRVFEDLWAVRTLLVRKDACPPLEQAGFYDFRFPE
jgi:tryptophan 2,3-dioxygenase